jgi:hypothetical protein
VKKIVFTFQNDFCRNCCNDFQRSSRRDERRTVKEYICCVYIYIYVDQCVACRPHNKHRRAVKAVIQNRLSYLQVPESWLRSKSWPRKLDVDERLSRIRGVKAKRACRRKQDLGRVREVGVRNSCRQDERRNSFSKRRFRQRLRSKDDDWQAQICS